jgi:fibronectin-binding autotransporter adhesin
MPKIFEPPRNCNQQNFISMNHKAKLPIFLTTAPRAHTPLARVALIILGLTLATGAQAFDELKAPNNVALNSDNSWSGDTNVPSLTDHAIVNSVMINAQTCPLGGNVSWGQLEVASSATKVLTISSGNTLTLYGLGSPLTGIDMSAAGTGGGATIDCAVALPASQTWSVDVAAALDVEGIISGSGMALTLNGPGTVTLGGANTYSGGTTLSGNCRATVNATAAVFGSASTAVTVGSGSQVDVHTGSPSAYNYTISGTGWNGDGLGAFRIYTGFTVPGTITLSGNARIAANNAGSPTATVSAAIGDGGNGYGLDASGGTATGILILSGANTYSGGTTVSMGTLKFSGGANRLLAGSSMVVNAGATNNLNGQAQTFGSVTGTGSIALGAGALTIGSDGSSPIFGGVISGSGSLTKTGAGTLTLSGTNTYNGNTVINAGTLALSGSNSINNTSAFSIAAGATLDVSAITAYALGGGTSLAASGMGTTVSNNAAAINGANGGTVSLGSNAITLTFDGMDPALYIAQGTLLLSNNLFTVNAAAPLAAGVYTLVQQAGGNISAAGTLAITGTAIGAPGTESVISVSGGQVILTIVNVASVSVETAADGSGTVVGAQNLPAGGGLPVYAIARAADGTFLANVSATWSLVSLTGGVMNGDLVPAGDGKSAIFTGHLVGSASVRVAWAGLTSATPVAVMAGSAQMTGPASFTLTGTGLPNQLYTILASTNLAAPFGSWWVAGSANADGGGGINFVDMQATNAQEFYRIVGLPTDSGTLSVVAGAATQVGVETAGDGSGTVVPAQTIGSGYTLAVYAITRDALGNFVANAPADSWTMTNVSGGVVNTDLSPISGPSAAFTGNNPGSGIIEASIAGLTSVFSGVITVVSETTDVWSATPANYQWDTISANWTGGTIFETGDSVLFTDNGSAASPINLVGNLAPESVTVSASANHYTFSGSGSLVGAGSLKKGGSGTLTLANTSPNTYAGATLVDAGTLEVATAASFNTAHPSPITVASGATLFMNVSGITTWSNNVSGAGLWQVATGTGSQVTTLAGNYSAFSGTLEVTTGNGKVMLPTAASFPGAGATLQLDPNTTAFFPNGGTFAGAINMYGGVTGEALGQLRIRSGTVLGGPMVLLADTTIGVDGNSTAAISGNMSGGYGFTKLSTGTLTLSGNNTYAGNTTVSNGMLNVNGTLASNSGTVTVTGGGVLGGNGTILCPVQILSDGILSPGVAGLGVLTVTNNITLAGQTLMQVNKLNGTSATLAATGNMTFGGTLVVSNLAGTFNMGDGFNLFSAASFSGSFSSISPATPGSGLVWDTSSLAVDGQLRVLGNNISTSTVSYGGYSIKVSSQFNAFNSLVQRPYPLYNYSVNVLKVGTGYVAINGGDYTGSGEDGDHIFGWSSPTGLPNTWVNLEGGGASSASSVPLFLQSNTFGANTMDPEPVYNPANSTWYMYVQKQRSAGDQIMALTSTDLKNWTPFTSRSVVTNIASGVVFQHEEAIYVPWSSTPFWLYCYLEESGVQKGYKLFRSNDPLAFNYTAQTDSGGERNTGGQRGYLLEAKNGPLFVRITSETVGGASVPIIQFSGNGTSWTYSGYAVLQGSSNTGNYSNCYFPGISTINGDGALEYLGHNRWKAIYAATTSASPTAPDIYNSEIGCGEVIIDLN